MAGFSLLKPLGFFYAVVLILVLTYLWYSGKWKQKAGWIILLVSTVLGFVISSPLAPHQFQELMLRNVQALGVSIMIAAIGLLIIFLLTFLFGRFFCGYLCPIGAVQELVSRVPVPKLVLRQKVPLMVIRGVVFVVFLYMAWVLAASLLDYFGISDFFALALTAGSIVFVVMLLVSMVFYRPFCRIICPYGLLLSLAAGTSLFALQRTDACIDCKCCERICPVNEAKRNDRKAECYLCGRCTDVCPTPGALQYRRRTGKEKS